MEVKIKIAPTLLRSLYADSFNQIKNFTKDISHSESLLVPEWGGNSMHWIVGHIVVSRCNFLIPLDISPIWEWSKCKLFIPGSKPTPSHYNHIDFETICADLDRTQNELNELLLHVKESYMDVVHEGRTAAEHLATYAAHESYHAGQLELLRQWLRN